MAFGQENGGATLEEAQALLRKVREAASAPVRLLTRAIDSTNGEEADMECYIVSQTKDGQEVWGAEDIRGKEIIPMKYNSVTFHRTSKEPYRYYFMAHDKDDKPLLFDNRGRVIIDSGIYDKIIVVGEYDCISVEKNKLRGICDWTGKEIVAPKWFWIYPNENGYFDVRDGDYKSDKTKYGIIGLNGKVILPCEYTRINTSRKDVTFVYKNGYQGMLDKKWKMILPCEYSEITIHDTLGVCVAAKGSKSNSISGSKWGLFTLDGKALSSLDYDYIGKYAEGLFLCNKGCSLDKYAHPTGGLYGYLDVKGNLLIPCKYEEASPFKDGVAQVLQDGVSQLLQHPIHGTKLHLANGGGTTSKVDTNIPESSRKAENTFAFIIANENYTNFSGSDYSINDGKVFKEYCNKTLGLPEKNIRYLEDATFGNIVNLVKKTQDIADVYEGDATIILYFSGLGTTTKNKESFLLPVDASPDALETTGYSLSSLMKELNGLNTNMTLVILDAPFSGTDKSGKMLAQHRGVQIMPLPTKVSGNTVLCISSSKTETSYSDKRYSHSLFTYAMLEKLQTSKGNCTIKETIEEATRWVKRESMNNYDKSQTPQVNVSGIIENKWNTIKW